MNYLNTKRLGDFQFGIWNLKYHALIDLHLYSSLPKIELRSVDICIYVPLGINTYC